MLGRGLESLIPNKGKEEVSPSSSPVIKTETDKKIDRIEAIFQIEVDKISLNPLQPRHSFDQEALKELAFSIREFGILQPLIVSKIERETEHGTEVEYQLIAGERRLHAAKLLGMERVPAIVKSVPHEREKLEIALIENVQREDLNVMEAARAYAKLQDTFGLTQREIAAKIGKSRETVANTLRLLNLPSHVQDALASDKISDSQARLLLGIADQAKQEQLFNEIINNNLSVRDLKKKITAIGRGNRSAPRSARLAVSNAAVSSPATVIDPELAIIADTLEDLLGVRVELEKDEATGIVKLVFSSTEDVQVLVDKLSSSEEQT